MAITFRSPESEKEHEVARERLIGYVVVLLLLGAISLIVWLLATTSVSESPV
ncbi:MAG: hypothetical protein O2856_13175 [Planctomycetota bacterium]|nr:hypothetical protein [Planctomycetota bacterium]